MLVKFMNDLMRSIYWRFSQQSWLDESKTDQKKSYRHIFKGGMVLHFEIQMAYIKQTLLFKRSLPFLFGNG